MAVAFDAKGTIVTATGVTSFTNTSLTIGAISNGALVVYLQFENTTSFPTSLVVNWDSAGTPQAMTQIGTKQTSDNAAVVYLFGLLSPHTGNKTLSVSWTNSSAYNVQGVSFSGVGQTSFATTFKNLATDATSPGTTGDYPAPSGMAITTISGDMAVLGATSSAGGFNVGGGLGTQAGKISGNAAGDNRYLAAVGASTSIAANGNTTAVAYSAVGCAISAVGNVADILQSQACL